MAQAPEAVDPARYALVVGTNLGGPGQSPLRYAHDDAGRVADVLTSLGGVPAEQVRTLLQPTAAEMEVALEQLRGELQAHADRGEPSRFFFYYSGHARADALNLGDEQVPLAALRDKLLSLPSTVSLVVLDACQSGAFSRAKGAEPAADFSWNSVQRLDTEGVAVIASSSSQELSQESDELRSGHFTHHWLVALRGAGDQNADGRVTLAEAYQYAYNRTLATTATTAIGEQHVTLETNLTGKGELALTHPKAADARLQLSAALSGRVLVQSLPSWSPLAELDKVRGARLELALPAGRYAATLRQAGGAVRCSLVLESGKVATLAPQACAPVAVTAGVAKGVASPTQHARATKPDPRADEGLILELIFGYSGRVENDTYSERLTAFGFQRTADDDARFAATLGYRLQRHLVVGLWYFNLDGADYVRESDEVDQSFVWDAFSFGAFVQADVPLFDLRLINPFVRVGGGLTVADTEFDAIKPNDAFADMGTSVDQLTANTEKIEKTQLGYYGALAAGLQIMPSEHVGMTFEARYVYAPALENALGETHDLGGLAFSVGLRLRTWN